MITAFVTRRLGQAVNRKKDDTRRYRARGRAKLCNDANLLAVEHLWNAGRKLAKRSMETNSEERTFDFVEAIRIAAPTETVWDALLDIEQWWPPSNPEHDSIERLDDTGELAVGTRFRIREKVAGVPGEAIGVITGIEPGTQVSWQADRARYRLLGISFTICEGVTWRVDPDGSDASRLSAHVWARFPQGVVGHVLEFVFRRLLTGIEKDRRHARIELEYLKATIEPAITD